MASSAAIRAGRAVIEILTDSSKLRKGLDSAAANLKSWGSSLSSIGTRVAAVGAASVGGLVGAAGVYASIGSELQDMSDRTGIAASELSTLRYAVDQSGATMGDFETGVKIMQKTLAAAAGGSKEANEALAAVGLTFAELDGLSPDEQFKRIADGLASISDPAKRTAAALKIFGRGGAAMLPLVNGGSAGINALQAEGKKRGFSMTDQEIKNAEAFGDLLGSMKMKAMAAVSAVGSALAPTLARLFEIVGGGLGAFSAWIQNNEGVVATSLKVAIAVAGVGFALVAVGKVLGIASVAMVAFKVVVAAAALANSIFWATLAGGPIAILAVGAAVAALVTSARGLGTLFDGLGDTFKTAWEGIKKAIAAGDIDLAFRILGVSLELIWARMIERLMGRWVDFQYAIKMKAAEWAGAMGGVARMGYAREKQEAKQQYADASAERAKHLEELISVAKARGEAVSTVDDKRKQIAKDYGAGIGIPGSIGSTAGTFNGILAGLQFGGGQTRVFQDQLATQKQMAGSLKAIEKKKGGVVTP